MKKPTEKQVTITLAVREWVAITQALEHFVLSCENKGDTDHQQLAENIEDLLAE